MPPLLYSPPVDYDFPSVKSEAALLSPYSLIESRHFSRPAGPPFPLLLLLLCTRRCCILSRLGLDPTPSSLSSTSPVFPSSPVPRLFRASLRDSDRPRSEVILRVSHTTASSEGSVIDSALRFDSEENLGEEHKMTFGAGGVMGGGVGEGGSPTNVCRSRGETECETRGEGREVSRRELANTFMRSTRAGYVRGQIS